ncbi:MAG: hypothetical protein WDO71_10465 [Bacteroidota bacterium]
MDGIATTQANDIEIEANDSVYIFIQVNVNPNAANLAFVIRDSIQVSYMAITGCTIRSLGTECAFFPQ